MNEIINPVLQNGTFLQDPGLEPSDLALSGLQTVPETSKTSKTENYGLAPPKRALRKSDGARSFIGGVSTAVQRTDAGLPHPQL